MDVFILVHMLQEMRIFDWRYKQWNRYSKAEYLKNKVLAEDNLFCTNCSIKDYCINNRCKFMNKKITNDYYKPAPIACAIENIEDDLLKAWED